MAGIKQTPLQLRRTRRRAIVYLQKWIGHFYLWAGDDPSGFDCSGLILEVLKSVGLIRHKMDMTANMLYRWFNKNQTVKPGPGKLVFWFGNDVRSNKAIHVEMMIDNDHTVGASGGGSATKTIQDAIKHNAFVKMRPLNYRGMNYKICDPFAA